MEIPEKTPLDNVVNIADLRKMDEEAFNKWYMDKVHRQTAHLFGEPKRMINEDALLVAQRRWGVKNARIAWNPARLSVHVRPLGPYQVGTDRGELGCGFTWEEAFKNAEENEKRS
jgi:hypothetical protein